MAGSDATDAEEKRTAQICRRKPRPNTRQHLLPHPLLRRAVQRKMVQHQTAYRHGQGSKAQELRPAEIPHRSIEPLLGRHFQAGTYYRPPQATRPHCQGKAADYRLPDRSREQRKGPLLHILHVTQRRGAARCPYFPHRRRERRRRLEHRHTGGRKHVLLHHARTL